MFGLFKRKPVKLLPESRWVVSVDEKAIRVVDDAGETKSLGKDDLSGIAIETNDSGPWGADVWWLLFGGEDQLVCAYPQGATGEEAALDYFTTLPTFNHSAMIEAMSSTGNAVFSVWRRA